MHNYFGIGLKAKLAELKMKQETLAAEARLSAKTVQRAVHGEADDRSKQLIVEALGTTINAIEMVGRNRILARVWAAPESERKAVYELREVLDGYNLVNALSGKVAAYGISQPNLADVIIDGETVFRIDYERLVRVQKFLLSVMLAAPIDPFYAIQLPLLDWDKELKELETVGYRLFVGAAGPGRRAVMLVEVDDVEIREGADGARKYVLDLSYPAEAELENWDEEAVGIRPDNLRSGSSQVL
jgi:hypothetical protein